MTLGPKSFATIARHERSPLGGLWPVPPQEPVGNTSRVIMNERLCRLNPPSEGNTAPNQVIYPGRGRGMEDPAARRAERQPAWQTLT